MKRFFRLNHQYIATIGVIKDLVTYPNSRLKILLKDPLGTDVVLVSRGKVEAFKHWLASEHEAQNGL